MRIVPPLTNAERLKMVAAARSLRTAANGEPVPFRHQGRTLRGMDCIGLLVYAVSSLGYELNDRIDYGKLPADRKLNLAMVEHFGPPVKQGAVRVADLQIGDLVTMRWGLEEAHVALICDHPHGVGMLHSYRSAEKVIEHRVDELIASRIYAVFRP